MSRAFAVLLLDWPGVETVPHDTAYSHTVIEPPCHSQDLEVDGNSLDMEHYLFGRQWYIVNNVGSLLDVVLALCCYSAQNGCWQQQCWQNMISFWEGRC